MQCFFIYHVLFYLSSIYYFRTLNTSLMILCHVVAPLMKAYSMWMLYMCKYKCLKFQIERLVSASVLACKMPEHVYFQYTTLKHNCSTHLIHIQTNICQEICSKNRMQVLNTALIGLLASFRHPAFSTLTTVDPSVAVNNSSLDWTHSL